MNFASKRKREDVEPEGKKSKNFLNESERQEYMTSNEWPVFNHPDGGIVKITPWGSLRQYQSANGETVTRFEDSNFSDYSFKSNKDLSSIYECMPSTPQSLYQPNSSSISPDRIKLSLSDEAESYVVNGYSEMTPPPPMSASRDQVSNSSAVQHFGQEQENYFGMDQQEEFDIHEDIARSSHCEDSEMT